MDIERKIKDVFVALFGASNGLLAYTLYSRFRLMPSEAVDFINKYSEAGYIDIDEEQRIKITKKGYNDILFILDDLNSSPNLESDYCFKELDPKASSINIFEPYIPTDKFFNTSSKEKW